MYLERVKEQLAALKLASPDELKGCNDQHFPQLLPDDAWVFFMHQGYQFSFFRLGEGEDPPTYSYRKNRFNRGSFPRLSPPRT